MARKTKVAVARAMRRLLDHDARAGSLFAASGRYRNRNLPARSLPMTSASRALPPSMAVNRGLLPTPDFRRRSGSFDRGSSPSPSAARLAASHSERAFVTQTMSCQNSLFALDELRSLC
jgi:hypothetical protein